MHEYVIISLDGWPSNPNTDRKAVLSEAKALSSASGNKVTVCRVDGRERLVFEMGALIAYDFEVFLPKGFRVPTQVE